MALPEGALLRRHERREAVAVELSELGLISHPPSMWSGASELCSVLPPATWSRASAPRAAGRPGDCVGYRFSVGTRPGKHARVAAAAPASHPDRIYAGLVPDQRC